MSSGPLAAPSAGNVTWQVDIPSLSRLILGAGAQGLKQLALAGVDIHAVGCMLMIGEYTPASNTFRQSLNRCRQAQRAERIWIYKVVEIGGGHSYLVDKFLNTRAGENVLALMTAIASVMPEQACVTVLSKLFEDCGADAKDVPGLSQLAKIRDALLPMARRMDFKERVLQYHSFLWSLIQSGGPSSENDPFDAILGELSISTVIEALHRVATQQGKYRLVYYGIPGAAWVTTYAYIVLGLEVCALGKDGVPVPLSGTYQTAKVVIDVSKESKQCELYKEDEIQSFIQTEAISQNVRHGWSVNCSTFNFLDYNHPGLQEKPEFSRLSDFVAADTLNEISALASHFLNREKYGLFSSQMAPKGFLPYTLSVLPDIQLRGLQILRILGFSPQNITGYSFRPRENCENYTCLGTTADEVEYEVLEEEERAQKGNCHDPPHRYLEDICTCVKANRECLSYCRGGKQVASTRNTSTIKMRSKNRYRGPYVPEKLFKSSSEGLFERLGYYLDSPSEMSKHTKWDMHLQKEISWTARRAIEFASELAFTDWDTSLRLMSARFIRSRPMDTRTEPEPMSRGSSLEGHLLDAILLCTDSMNELALRTRTQSNYWLATDFDGVILLRNMALTRSVNKLKGIFLTFVPGRIRYEDTSYFSICSDNIQSYEPLDYKTFPESQNWFDDVKGISSPTKSVTSDLKFKDLFTASANTLWVRLEVFFQGKFRGIVEVKNIANAIPQLLVSVPCSTPLPNMEAHNFHDPILKPSTWKASTIRTWREGFAFSSCEDNSWTYEANYGAYFYNQCVPEDPEAQWLACQWLALDCPDSLIVLRKNCCLTCTLRNLRPLLQAIFPLPAFRSCHVCLITGNEKGEVMSDCWGPPQDQLEAELEAELEAPCPLATSPSSSASYWPVV